MQDEPIAEPQPPDELEETKKKSEELIKLQRNLNYKQKSHIITIWLFDFKLYYGNQI